MEGREHRVRDLFVFLSRRGQNMKRVQAPASKSVSHRMMIGAALADGTSLVGRVLESKDLERTMAILRSAGAGIERTGDGDYTVTGMAGRPVGGAEIPLSCNVHESGTTCRLLTAVLAAGSGAFRVHGAPRMHERPIGELTAALERLGARFCFEGKPGFPPFVLRAQGLFGGNTSIGMDESSQYLSGLLLAAPMVHGPLTVMVEGSKVVSWPYVGLTLETLELFGIPFTVACRSSPGEAWQAADWRSLNEVRPGLVRFLIQPAVYRAGRYTVEGDWSGASYLLAAGAVGTEPVRVEGLNSRSLQGDRAILDILRSMGGQVKVEEDAVVVSPSPLHGVTVDMNRCPDLVPTVAVLAAFAEGTTTVTNVAHLRIKESDRIAAPAEELGRIGIRTIQHSDGLSVEGRGKALRESIPSLDQIAFSAHGDHRIAMSLALLERLGGRIVLDDPACVRKSFPDFWTRWEQVR